MENNILEVKNLTAVLNNEKIIDKLSFTVAKGDFFTIIGSNGSGKTVLLRTLLGFVKVFEGEIIWNKNIKIGYLPQGLTRLALGSMPLRVRDFLDLKKIASHKMIEVLDLLDINKKNILKKKMGDLSGGQFQKILLAWALADNPDVLLLDEPTTGIDIKGEKTVYNLLNNLRGQRKLTVILITHDLNVVYKHSNSVLCVSHDNVCHATPREVTPEMLEKVYQMPIKLYKHNH